MARGQRANLGSEHDFIITKDMNGNEVKIPLKQMIDRRIPEKNMDGVVTEFVNVCGKVFQIALGAPQENDTIKVPPFGIVKGEQWRDKSEPSPAWGDNPPFMERKHSDGKFDGVYLLTEEQVAWHVERINSWQFGPQRLEMFRTNAKIQTYGKTGKPERPPEELWEDRPKVNAAIGRKTAELKRKGERSMDLLTGRRAG